MVHTLHTQQLSVRQKSSSGCPWRGQRAAGPGSQVPQTRPLVCPTGDYDLYTSKAKLCPPPMSLSTQTPATCVLKTETQVSPLLPSLLSPMSPLACFRLHKALLPLSVSHLLLHPGLLSLPSKWFLASLHSCPGLLPYSGLVSCPLQPPAR